MSRAYDDSRYLARTLAASLLDLEPPQQNQVLAYLKEELHRLGISNGGNEAKASSHWLSGTFEHAGQGD
jgi:hypothetical protein